MAVICEALSVIVRRDSIESYHQGGWDNFLLKMPNKTYCWDDELVRVGFMTPDAVGKYIELLQSNGLQFNQMIDSNAEIREIDDIIVVDQIRGPTLECNWIEFGQLPFGEDKVSACWLFEGERKGYGTHFSSTQMTLATPKNWSPSDLNFVDNSEIKDKLKYLRTEDGNDVYWDYDSKKEVFVASS